MNLTGRPPLGLKGPKQKNGTKAGLEYMARVKMLPCVICGAAPPSDAHHVICGRYGTIKSSDYETIPLCKRHHQVGPNAIHNGKASWVGKYGPDHFYLDMVEGSISEGSLKDGKS